MVRRAFLEGKAHEKVCVWISTWGNGAEEIRKVEGARSQRAVWNMFGILVQEV